MNQLDLALALSQNKKQLKQRLVEFCQQLNPEHKQHFSKPTFNFEKQQLIGANGYYLQWQVRQRPDKPADYINIQQSRGIVLLKKQSN